MSSQNIIFATLEKEMTRRSTKKKSFVGQAISFPTDECSSSDSDGDQFECNNVFSIDRQETRNGNTNPSPYRSGSGDLKSELAKRIASLFSARIIENDDSDSDSDSDDDFEYEVPRLSREDLIARPKQISEARIFMQAKTVSRLRIPHIVVYDSECDSKSTLSASFHVCLKT